MPIKLGRYGIVVMGMAFLVSLLVGLDINLIDAFLLILLYAVGAVMYTEENGN